MIWKNYNSKVWAGCKCLFNVVGEA